MTQPATPGSVIATLERWEAHGASWRVLSRTERLAVVELCTCHGEPVDQIRSSDPAFLSYLAGRGQPSAGFSRTPLRLGHDEAPTLSRNPGRAVVMQDQHGASTFQVSGEAYDRFVGRYSTPLARSLADLAGLEPGATVLDVGCGPGALTSELVRRLGSDSVVAIDPSEPFVAECRRRHPGVDVRLGSAEALPFADDAFDAALAQLVLHFVADPASAAAELRRVLRPGGITAACVWDFHDGMVLIRHYWDAALTVDPRAPDEANTLRFGRDGEIGELFAEAGFADVATGAITVEAAYEDFDELWSGFTGGPGPAGAFLKSLDPARQERLRNELRRRLGDPQGGFTLPARAWYGTGRA